jgi:outer membrane protein OmpA-like peptidoglycan-associated protein
MKTFVRPTVRGSSDVRRERRKRRFRSTGAAGLRHVAFSLSSSSDRQNRRADLAADLKETTMHRRFLLAGLALAVAAPGLAFAQDRNAPSSRQIMRQLDAAPRRRVRPEERVTIQEFRRRPDLRRDAPSLDIQAINFAFGSAEIPRSEFRKVREIAEAFSQMAQRRRRTMFLIEGHTDAVGSRESNQVLSERRAASLKRVLVNEFQIPSRMIETVGYGEDFLLIDTQSEEWRNRRVTIRRIDEFVR